VLSVARNRHLSPTSPNRRGARGRQSNVALCKSLYARLAGLIVLALLAVVPAHAATDFVFSVTEGVTYQATPKEIRDKFEPLAELLAKALKRNVRLVLVPAYNDVRAGLANQEYDLAFIHPAHVAMAEIKAGRYQSVGWTSGYTEYRVSLLTTPDQPIKSLDEIKGHVLVTPDPDSITAAMVRAMLRADKFKPDAVKVITTRYQDAIPFYLENTFAQVGATAANSVVKQWTDKGGKVVARSRGVPIKQFIAAARLPQKDRDTIRDVLLTLAQSDAGRHALATSGYKGFVAPEPDVEKASIDWLGL
jgi:ABC-type phosphate/phosphonate transport system substrate-binding protein